MSTDKIRPKHGDKAEEDEYIQIPKPPVAIRIAPKGIFHSRHDCSCTKKENKKRSELEYGPERHPSHGKPENAAKSDKKAYNAIREFQSGMGNLSTQDFGALFSFGIENGQGPEYQSWEAYHQVIDSLQSGAILLSVEPKQSSPGEEKQRWEDNVAEVIGNTKKLLEPENFNRFMDAVVKTLPSAK